jgi:thymidylate kinase
MQRTLTGLLNEIAAAGLSYCLLRDAERLDDFCAGGELDLLIDPAHFVALAGILERHGFVRIHAWGHAPHQFFVNYDEAVDAWLKCDVVTQVAYGRPVHNLRTNLGEACLANRQRVGHAFAPSPEDELVTLLLHCVIDKQQFTPARIARLKTLRACVSRTTDLSINLGRYWSPKMTWARLAEMIDREEWDALLTSRAHVIATIARLDRVGTIARGVRDRALRKLRRLRGIIRPTVPSVALLAPDGAGKSTLTHGIREHLPFPVATVYMGLYQQRPDTPWARIPALGLASHVLTQWRRYLEARLRQAEGCFVVFDRYTYDALLPVARPLNLLKRLRRQVLARACPAPDLAIVLDAPGEVLYARKREHDVVLLEQQRQGYLRIQSAIERTAVVDATLGPEELRRAVTTLIWRIYRERRAGRSTH